MARASKADAQLKGQLEVQKGVNIGQLVAIWNWKVSDQKEYKGPVNDQENTSSSKPIPRETADPEEELVPSDVTVQRGAPT